MGMRIEPRSEDAELVIKGCKIVDTDDVGIRVAEGVTYDIQRNRFVDVGVEFTPGIDIPEEHMEDSE